MIKQGSQNGPVLFAFNRVEIGLVEQGARFGVADSGGRTFVAVGFRALHALDGVMRDGIVFATGDRRGRTVQRACPGFNCWFSSFFCLRG